MLHATRYGKVTTDTELLQIYGPVLDYPDWRHDLVAYPAHQVEYPPVSSAWQCANDLLKTILFQHMEETLGALIDGTWELGPGFHVGDPQYPSRYYMVPQPNNCYDQPQEPKVYAEWGSFPHDDLYLAEEMTIAQFWFRFGFDPEEDLVDLVSKSDADLTRATLRALTDLN